jgi:hypothetical protein
VKNSVDVDLLAFDGVEDEIVLNNEVTVVQTGKFLLFRNSAQAGTAGKKL